MRAEGPRTTQGQQAGDAPAAAAATARKSKNAGAVPTSQPHGPNMATHPPDHAFTDMLKTARRAAASLASQASTTAEPETAARKLEKFGGDRDKLTPAQARRVRKAERRATAS